MQVVVPCHCLAPGDVYKVVCPLLACQFPLKLQCLLVLNVKGDVVVAEGGKYVAEKIISSVISLLCSLLMLLPLFLTVKPDLLALPGLHV